MRRNRGFTLLELLIVVAILVILAALLLPRLSSALTKSQQGSTANQSGRVLSALQEHAALKATQYSDNWDSVLDTGATGPDPTYTTPALQATFTIQTLTANQAASLKLAGINTITDYTASSTAPPGERWTTVRPVAASGKVLTPIAASASGKAIADYCYPQNKLSTGTSGAVPAGYQLLAVGVGPTNTAIGLNGTMQSCPKDASVSSAKYYNNFIAVFQVPDAAPTEPAQLMAVVSANGYTPDTLATNYGQ